MNNKERTSAKIQQVKDEENVRKAITNLADIVFDIGITQCEEIEKVRAMTEGLRVKLFGNGDPSASIITRLHSVECKVDKFQEDITDIKNMLIGGVDKDTPSVKERLANTEEHVKRSERLQWFLVTTILAYIITQVLSL